MDKFIRNFQLLVFTLCWSMPFVPNRKYAWWLGPAIHLCFWSSIFLTGLARAAWLWFTDREQLDRWVKEHLEEKMKGGRQP